MSFACALVVSLVPPAQAGAIDAGKLEPAESRRIEVSELGAFEQRENGWAAPGDASAKLTSPGLAWTRTDGGAAWIATAVSLGDRGFQVFSEYDLNNEAAELLSAFDSDPPTPVWTDGGPLLTEFRQVASANTADVHVAIDQVVVGSIATRQAVLRKYTSKSSTPDWTYTFPPLINASSHVGISRNGQRIVAAIFNDQQFRVEIAVFDASSGVPLSYSLTPTGTGNYLRGFDLAAEGSTLYFAAGATFYVFDVDATTVTFLGPLQGSFDSHAISGSGNVVANGSFNNMYVWERQGSTYVQTYTRTVGGQNYCADIDISDDGSTIASGWTFYGNYLTVVTEALDVATKTTTMSNSATGAGGFQNVIADVAISGDGRRIAVGVWGDQAGVVPELRVFDRDSPVPLASVNTPGSVFDVDISVDGQRAVAGSKAVHANVNGNGGRVDLLDLGGEDLDLRGVPRLGATVDFDVHGEPGDVAFVLQSFALDPTPAVFSGIGTLFIDRATLTIYAAGPIQASGIATLPYAIGTDPAQLGNALFFQGYTVAPRTLSSDWIKMTFLP